MADADQQILIEAYLRYGKIKGRPAIVTLFDQAFCDLNSGVTVTSVTFEGASGSGTPNQIDSAKLLAVCEQVLQIMDGEGETRATFPSFNGHFLQA